MKHLFLFSIIFQLIAMASCSTNPATPLPQSPSSTSSIVPTSIPSPTLKPSSTFEPIPYLFSTYGPYNIGVRIFTFNDPARENREVSISVRYPAIVPEDKIGSEVPDAPVDLTHAPYPVILSSSKTGAFFGLHLVSYGFVSVGVRNIDTYNEWDQTMIDMPLDILFALDKIGSQPLEGLEGMIDPDNSGVMGYSFDGYNSLAMSGARIDPEFYLEQCNLFDSMVPPLTESSRRLYCTLASQWDQFTSHAGSHLTESEDGLWQPMTDPRIRAVMPMAPEGAWLFGERGLAAVDRPTLIIGATKDGICPYEMEAVYIYEHLGSLEKYLISFVGKGHMMVYDSEPIAQMNHFATAFFGYYLQGHTEYARYFMEDFVRQYDGLAWGVYTGP